MAHILPPGHAPVSYTHLDVYKRQGTKEACLSALSAKGYAPGHVLMVGDALGDLAAAQHADALFYPCLLYTSRCV